VAAPLLVRDEEPAANVAVVQGLARRARALVDAERLSRSWGPLLAAAEGVPEVAAPAPGVPVLGNRWHVTAGHRKHFYALAGAAREHDAGHEDDHRACCRILTVGLIDPCHDAWGHRVARIGGHDYTAPCVSLDDLARRDAGVAGWCRQRAQPKVVVATQGRVIEAVADPAGTALPCTPVISVEGRDPFAALAVLLAPRTTAWLAGELAGSGLAAGSLRVSARSLRTLSLPVEIAAWEEAADLLERLHQAGRAPDEPTWRHLGDLMAAAYDHDGVVTSWWLARVLAVVGGSPTAGKGA
jgi:hypothetical protein